MLKLKILFVLSITVISTANLLAQDGYPDSVYRSGTGRERTPGEVEAAKQQYNRQQQQKDIDYLKNIGDPLRKPTRVLPKYASLTKQQSQVLHNLIVPEIAESEPYKTFLKTPKTGLIRLLAPNDCVPAIQQKSYFGMSPNFDEKCPQKYLMNGGSYFSFRRNDYSPAMIYDLAIQKDLLFSRGYLNQSLMVELGDVPIEKVSRNTNGMNFLFDFVPAKIDAEAQEQMDGFTKGVKSGSFLYGNQVKAIPNQTYGLRVVAYNGKAVVTISQKPEIERDLLEDDERADVIVAFRVLGFDNQGNVSIIWKELKRSNSPKIRSAK